MRLAGKSTMAGSGGFQWTRGVQHGPDRFLPAADVAKSLVLLSTIVAIIATWEADE